MVNLDSLQFFELIHIADLLQQMVDVYYTEDIVTFKTKVLSDLGSTKMISCQILSSKKRLSSEFLTTVLRQEWIKQFKFS